MSDNIIDISHWADPVDFGKIAASGIVAVIAKATQGTKYVDNTYAKFKDGASGKNLLWGSYHFGTGDDVHAQVEHYLQVAPPVDKQFACLDFEPNPNGPQMSLNQAREFIDLYQHLTGRLPCLYAGHWLKEQLTAKDDILAQCPLWIAQYGPKAVLPIGWGAYTMWQYTDIDQNVGGVGKVDRSRFNGSDDDLRAAWPFS